MPSGLLDLPFGLLSENVLSQLDAASLVKLRLVNSELRAMVDDDVLWRRKAGEDYNLPAHATARISGFQNLYKGLTRPRVFVWGQKENCRLGIKPSQLREDVRDLVTSQGGAPFPLVLDYTQAGGVEETGSPVEIVAGGWSFHVLTSKGEVLFWGTLDGGMVSRDDEDLRDPYARVSTPRVLARASADPVRSISAGRSHAVALTRSGQMLEWHNWSIAALHEPLLEVATSGERAHVEQLEAGWDFTVALVHRGGRGVATSQLVYWHNDWVEEGEQGETTALTNVRRVALPALPTPSQEVLEEMRVGENAADEDAAAASHQLIVKVGAGEQWVVALTASGLIYRLQTTLPVAAARGSDDTHPSQRLKQLFDSGAREWQLMDEFCLPSRIAELREFREDPTLRALVTPEMRITHISAQFRNFVAYSPSAGANAAGSEASSSSSSGIVLIGGGREAEQTPDVKSELQGIGVIKMSMGDWHYGALTASGKVLTWGSWSNGALGTWDSLPVLPGDDEGRRATPTGPVDRVRRARGGGGGGVRIQPIGRIGFAGRGGGRARGGLVRFGASGPIDGGDGEDVGDDNDSRRDDAPDADDGSASQWEQRLRLRNVPWSEGLQTPTEVQFDPAARRASGGHDSNFVFDIAFAGWHSSAIAIDSKLVGGETAVRRADEQEEDEDEGRPPRPTFHALQSSTRSSSPLTSAERPAMTSFDPDVEILHRIRAQRRAQRVYHLSVLLVIAGCVSLSGYLDRFWPDDDAADEQRAAYLHTSSFWPALITFWPLAVPLGLYAVIARWSGERLWRFS